MWSVSAYSVNKAHFLLKGASPWDSLQGIVYIFAGTKVHDQSSFRHTTLQWTILLSPSDYISHPLHETHFSQYRSLQLYWGGWPCPYHVHLLKSRVNLCVPPWQQGAQNFMTLDNNERDVGQLLLQAGPNQPQCISHEWYQKLIWVVHKVLVILKNILTGGGWIWLRD